MKNLTGFVISFIYKMHCFLRRRLSYRSVDIITVYLIFSFEFITIVVSIDEINVVMILL